MVKTNMTDDKRAVRVYANGPDAHREVADALSSLSDEDLGGRTVSEVVAFVRVSERGAGVKIDTLRDDLNGSLFPGGGAGDAEPASVTTAGEGDSPKPPQQTRVKLTPSSRTTLSALAERGPSTGAELSQHVDYSSVPTILSRLYEKGLVARESESTGAHGGWAYRYWLTGAGRDRLQDAE